MTASLNQMLLAFWRQQQFENRWSRRLFYTLLLAGAAAQVWLAPTAQARSIACVVIVCTALFGLWLVIFVNLLEQNHPTAARLVPGHLRKLREAALLAWLTFTGAMGFALWLMQPPVAALPALLLAAAATAAFGAFGMRHWQLWFVFAVGSGLIAPLQLYERWAALWAAIAGAWQAQPWFILALSVLATGTLLTRAFSNGSAAHQARYASRKRMRQASLEGMTGNPAGLAALGRTGEFLARPFDAAMSAFLAHLLARAQRQEASVMARAVFVLHGLQHWLRHLMGVGLALALVGLGFALCFALLGAQFSVPLKNGSFGLGIGLVSITLNPGLLPNMLWHTRREQALLVLLPGMPRGGSLNRALARAQLRHFLVAWALTTVALLLVADAANQPTLMLVPITALPLGILNLLRSPAAMQALTPTSASVPIVGFFLTAFMLWALCTWLSLPVWPFAAISLAASMVLLIWRWRALGFAPQALPAGRLA